jgi:hypothetical protein
MLPAKDNLKDTVAKTMFALLTQVAPMMAMLIVKLAALKGCRQYRQRRNFQHVLLMAKRE